jgi:hypothetical protein
MEREKIHSKQKCVLTIKLETDDLTLGASSRTFFLHRTKIRLSLFSLKTLVISSNFNKISTIFRTRNKKEKNPIVFVP